MSIPGVGCFLALAIVAEIGDVSRFPDEEKLCSYAGLAPYVDQSGSTAHVILDAVLPKPIGVVKIQGRWKK
jgi:transposase